MKFSVIFCYFQFSYLLPLFHLWNASTRVDTNAIEIPVHLMMMVMSILWKPIIVLLQLASRHANWVKSIWVSLSEVIVYLPFIAIPTSYLIAYKANICRLINLFCWQTSAANFIIRYCGFLGHAYWKFSRFSSQKGPSTESFSKNHENLA